MKHESVIGIYTEMAKVHHKQNDSINAIDCQKRALNLMIELDLNTDLAAEIAMTLAG